MAGEMATMHPTGMHSCIWNNFTVICKGTSFCSGNILLRQGSLVTYYRPQGRLCYQKHLPFCTLEGCG